MDDITSAGVVIFRTVKNKPVFLLLHYPTGHWDFVKGKIEHGESMRQTAIREAHEETGISDIIFVRNFREKVRYSFQHKGSIVNKKVIFFLGRTKSRNIVISDEHLDYVWMDYKKAMNRLTFINAKRILSKSRYRLAKTLKMQPS